MNLEMLPRKAILSLADSRQVTRFVTRYGKAFGAGRFVAGATLQEGLEAVRRLNSEGLLATLDNLGESVRDAAMAQAARDIYLEMLDAIRAHGLDCNVSVKLTQLGLDIDRDLCLENLRALVERARQYGNFVRIDMEDSRHTEATVEIFRQMRQRYDQVGLVLQAYLYRTEKDLESLAPLRPNLRLCKGAYNEPPDVAFPARARVDENFRRLIVRLLELGGYAAIATHNEQIIGFAKDYVARHSIPRDRFEFQMLYGIRPALQKSLAGEGYRVRVYVPFGTQWYPYLMRRLAERPANLWFVLSNALKR